MILLDILLSYILKPIVFYTLRIVKLPCWWLTLDEYAFWSISDKILATDILLFLCIVVGVTLWLTIGLLWVLYGIIGLAFILGLAWAFLKVRKLIKKK